jgi:hypothetical protein
VKDRRMTTRIDQASTTKQLDRQQSPATPMRQFSHWVWVMTGERCREK